MSSDFIVGAPTHSSTPKLEDSKKTADKLQSRKMASQMEGKLSPSGVVCYILQELQCSKI